MVLPYCMAVGGNWPAEMFSRCQSEIYVSPRMQVFPAEHCTGSRWEGLLTLPVSGFNVMADGCKTLCGIINTLKSAAPKIWKFWKFPKVLFIVWPCYGLWQASLLAKKVHLLVWYILMDLELLQFTTVYMLKQWYHDLLCIASAKPCFFNVQCCLIHICIFEKKVFEKRFCLFEITTFYYEIS